ncbi:unnamed protein product, partial [Urochloa humidicola]
ILYDVYGQTHCLGNTSSIEIASIREQFTGPGVDYEMHHCCMAAHNDLLLAVSYSFICNQNLPEIYHAE